MPWRDEPTGTEVNITFVVQNNLLFLNGASIDGRPGRFLIGSAQARTILDPKFTAGSGLHSLQLNQRESLPFSPVAADLHGVADAIVGTDVWGAHAITIDYRAGLLTFQKEGMHPELMIVYKFAGDPTINVTVDGRIVSAILDTTSPDTLVLPRTAAASDRRTAHIQIADTDFGNIDIRTADVTAPRVGNRLLSRFLVSIDYGRHQVGLWRDPRNAL
ncbi:MAG: hypothetical protein M3041_11615 [Acidobacteriota bacterium]|nr:hypothetical protein [Acidobacteriota bacterium]